MPERPAAAVVVCHPHPLYGGTMDNGIVAALVEHLARRGAATLRFNFRGVGGSEGGYGFGDGEVADTRAALALLRERSGVAPALAGYSFGAAVALRAALGESTLERVVAVAPPLALGALDALTQSTARLLVIAGEGDTYCPADALRAALPEHAEVALLAGADHFLAGFEDEVGERAAVFLAPPVR